MNDEGFRPLKTEKVLISDSHVGKKELKYVTKKLQMCL